MTTRPNRNAQKQKQTMEQIRTLRTLTDATQIEALETAILADNEKFVRFIARRYGEALEFDDALAVVRVGLLAAIRRFDVTKSDHFQMYASRCMRRAIVTEADRFAGPVRRPRREEQKPQRVSMQRQVIGNIALQETFASEEDVEAGVLSHVAAHALTAVIEELPPREAHVMRLRYPLDGSLAFQVSEIAALLGVSKQRAFAIEQQALKRLRERLQKEAA
jgi:RNA polymerase sporulation-specific sigma factor